MPRLGLVLREFEMPVQQCLFYAKGKCTKGVRCSFSHAQPATHHWTAPNANTVHTGPSSGFGPTKVNVPCKYYQLGRCQNPECRFLHLDTPLSTPRSSTQSTYSRQGSAIVAQSTLNPICPFFISGSCKYGEQCRYHHDKGSPLVTREHVRSPEPLLNVAMGSLELSDRVSAVRTVYVRVNFAELLA